MYGDEEPQQSTDIVAMQKKEHQQRLALIRQEARAIADTNDAIHARTPAITDAAAQVRIAIWGADMPSPDAPIEDLIRYCQMAVSRIPALPPGERGELSRTLADISDRAESQGRDHIIRSRINQFLFKLESLKATADPKAKEGLTAIMALISSNQTIKQDQTIRAPNPTPSPGMVDAFKNAIGVRR
jgi:hypothetical protein